MATKFDQRVYLFQLRQDLFVVTCAALIIIFGLWVVGAVSPGQGIFAMVLLASFVGLYYANRVTSLPRLTPVDEAAVTISSDVDAFEAKRSVLMALEQPTLIILDDRIKVRNTPANRIFNLPNRQEDLSVASLRDPALLQVIEQVRRLGGHAACELAPARNPGEHWLVNVTALGADPKLDGILLVMADQKPVRMAERARADFLANASHELRTPLTSISGFIETMKGPARGDLDAWPRFVDIMDEQTQHMKNLIGDLLSLSRIELSGYKVRDTQMELGQAVNDAVNALQHIGESRGLSLKVDQSSGPFPILGEESEIKQVILNLVGNAIKYAPENSDIIISLGRSASLDDAQTKAARSWDGAGRITLLNPPKQDGAAVWLRVQDNGAGIPKVHLPRLGERFFRVDESRGGPIEGTGLGLAIVKHIMAHHRGGLAVESIQGEGAAFSVWFPAVTSEN